MAFISPEIANSMMSLKSYNPSVVSKLNNIYMNETNSNNENKNTNDDQEVSRMISHDQPWWKSTALGYFTGIWFAIIGHPFDTIKVRLQTDTSKNIFKHLYKGILPPLLATPTCWSISYWSYSLALGRLKSNDWLSIWNAGCFSNLFWATCVTPVELIKCYSQRFHINAFESTRQIYNTLGQNNFFKFIRYGLFRGYVSALIRDVPAGGTYFLTYEYLRNKIPGYDKSSFLLPFLVGGTTSSVMWLVALPGDTIKSNIQTNFGAALHKDLAQVNEIASTSFIYNAKQIYNKYGLGGFYKGYATMFIRAFVVCGTSITATEHFKKFMDKF